MIRHRIISAMPLFLLFFLLLSGFVLDDWILGFNALALIPFAALLLASKPWKRLNQAMPYIAILIFLWLALDFDLAHPGWVVFFAIPLCDMLMNRGLEQRTLLSALIIAIYLVIGFVWHAWHPGWLAFLFVPILNILFFPKTSKRTFKGDLRSVHGSEK
ncbi:MAG: hypothetical protein ACLFUQ_07115 [Candidatus Izemoplasmataceae bacterium]